MTNTNDSQFEARLRTLYRQRIDRAAVPSGLQFGVLSIPESEPVTHRFFGSRRLLVLAMVGLLAALTVSGVIAIGSGLIRLPWLPDIPGPDLGAQAECGGVVEEGFVLKLSQQQTLTTLDRDGRLISGPGFPDSMDVAMTLRQMTPEGVALVVAAVEEADLATACGRTIYVDGEDGYLNARTSQRVVSISWGRTAEIELQGGSPTDQAAAATLAGQLTDLDSWLPADVWLDAAPATYSPERFGVQIARYPTGEGNPLPSATADASSVTLPDGTSPLSFGTMTYGPEIPGYQPPTPDGMVGPDWVRCGVVDLETAVAISDALVADGTHYDPTIAAYIVADGMATLNITIRPYRHHEWDCVQLAAFIAATAEESAVASATPIPSHMAYVENVCRFPFNQAAESVLGGGAVSAESVSPPDAPPGGVCQLYRGDTWVGNVHAFPASSETLVREQAEEHFGVDGVAQVAIAGRTAFTNGCADPEAHCAASMFIVDAMYTYWIIWTEDLPDGDATFEAMAAAFLALLDAE